MNIQENTAIFSLGPGAPDDAIPIQNAANNFSAVYLRSGTYNCKSKIAISSKTRIYAEKGARLIYANLTGSYNLMEITAEVVLDGLELDGNQANVANAIVGNSDDKQTLCAIKDGGSNTKILNCYIHDSWGAGVWVQAGSTTVSNVEIAGNHFKNIGFAGKQACNSIYCFRLGGGTNRNQIHNNYIEQQQDKTVGIYLHFDTDSLVQNNEIFSTVTYTGAGHGIQVDDIAARQNAVSGNHISGMVNGIYIDWTGTDAIIVSNNYVENCVNAGGGGTGIMIDNTNSGPPTMKCIVIANNICRANATAGIDVHASRTIVMGNICYDNCNNMSGSNLNKSGIKITNPGSSATLTDIMVVDNICFDSGGTTQRYGFSCDNTNGAVSNVYVSNNDFNGNQDGGIGNFLVNTNGIIALSPPYTLGQGVPSIVGLDNRTGITAVDGAPITLFAVPSGATQLYRISADIFATAFTSGTATYTITWTENAVTRTLVVTATALNTLGTGTDLINPDASTNISAQLTGVFTATVKVAGVVERIA